MNEVKTWPVVEAANQGGNILEQLYDGALVNFSLGERGVTVQASPDQKFGVLYLATNALDDFKLKNYKYNEALETATMVIVAPKYNHNCWSFIEDGGGINNAIILTESEETVVLSVSADNTNQINIQRNAPVPPPFVRSQTDGAGGAYLAFGFDSPLLFNFDVIILA